MDQTSHTYKQFSLRSRVVGAPVSRRARQTMIAMCPAGGLSGRSLQRMAHAAALFTSRSLRPVSAWPLPMSVETWAAVEREILSAAGIGMASGGVIWHLPPPDQPQIKFGALFLDAAGNGSLYARVLLAGELPNLTPRVDKGQRSGVRWPVRRGLFHMEGMSIELTTTSPSGLHVPATLDLPTVLSLCADVEDALDAPRPNGIPSQYRPMHGDLAFWNLRRYPTGEILLLDWEECAWAPPHADLTRFLMTSPVGAGLATGLPTQTVKDMAPAVDFWLGRLDRSSREDAPDWVIRKHAAQAANLKTILGRA